MLRLATGLLVATATVIVVSLPIPPAAATWAVPLAGGNNAVSQGGTAPATPGAVTATCVTLAAKVTVTWSAVARATSYTIYDSTTSASTGYATIASGVTGTSWTSGSLAIGSYWFEVVAYIGANWAGPTSAATAESTVALVCIQP